MSEHTQKQLRGKNFTEKEKELLIDLVLPFMPIIKNIKVLYYIILNT
jgi:hypothetical protein